MARRKLFGNKTEGNLAVTVVDDKEAMLDTLARNTMNNTYSICGKRIASIPTELMLLDYTYQRIVGRTIKELVTKWNKDKCDFLLVSLRNNRFYVINGQHRLIAATSKGIKELPCIIFTGLTQSQEALMFSQQNDNVNKLSNYDTYKANIACGDASIECIAIDLKIKQVCDRYGIEVKKRSNYNADQKILGCLSTARRSIGNFEWVINAINNSNWRDCPLAYSDKIYRALSSYKTDHSDDLDKANENLIKIMNMFSPDELVTKSRYEFSNYGYCVALKLCLRKLAIQAEEGTLTK